MYLVGKLTLSKVSEKEYEGRKYYKCVALADDKEVYNVSLSGSENPRVGDVYHMRIEASERDFKPVVRFQKEQ